MRGIKFRVYCRLSRKHHYDITGFECTKGKIHGVFIDGVFIDGDYVDVEDLIVEQFTGFKDSTGKEIYEGDMVRYNHDDVFIYTCKYNEHRREFGWYLDNEYIYPIGDARLHLKIIGNIHEGVKDNEDRN